MSTTRELFDADGDPVVVYDQTKHKVGRAQILLQGIVYAILTAFLTLTVAGLTSGSSRDLARRVDRNAAITRQKVEREAERANERLRLILCLLVIPVEERDVRDINHCKAKLRRERREEKRRESQTAGSSRETTTSDPLAPSPQPKSGNNGGGGGNNKPDRPKPKPKPKPDPEPPPLVCVEVAGEKVCTP